ncbi:hypothetical protein BGY98DRAFT_931510 [Russula aff. rugulosa BPL654]|nr:hypothetical protein BGY98DRAFT_931510 [Russula aff. rugulosa BPL654]
MSHSAPHLLAVLYRDCVESQMGVETPELRSHLSWTRDVIEQAVLMPQALSPQLQGLLQSRLLTGKHPIGITEVASLQCRRAAARTAVAFMADLRLLLVHFLNYATYCHPGSVFPNWPTFIVNVPSAQRGTPLHAACRCKPMRAQASPGSATLRVTD